MPACKKGVPGGLWLEAVLRQEGTFTVFGALYGWDALGRFGMQASRRYVLK